MIQYSCRPVEKGRLDSTVYFELTACIISLFALIYGIVSILKFRMPMYFRLPVAATGCYVLEELWVVANTFFGSYDSFITVRLFGIFGFFCFLLCANTGGIDKFIDDGKEKNGKARIPALVAPILLFVIFLMASINKFGKAEAFNVLLAILVFSPLFPASYYNVKHLFLKNDDMGFLRCIRGCDIICLIIYIFNLTYLIKYPENLIVLSYIADIIMALLVLALNIISVKGGKEWKTHL